MPQYGAKGFHSKFSANVTGAEEVTRTIARLGGPGKEAAMRVLVQRATVIKDKAQRLAPDDEETRGLLAETIRLSPTRKFVSGRLTVSIIAGGRPLEPAMGKRRAMLWPMIQHEDLQLKHDSGQAKYIEQPFLEVAPTVPERVLEAMDKVAKS